MKGYQGVTLTWDFGQKPAVNWGFYPSPGFAVSHGFASACVLALKPANLTFEQSRGRRGVRIHRLEFEEQAAEAAPFILGAVAVILIVVGVLLRSYWAAVYVAPVWR